MSKRAAHGSRIWADEFALSGFLNSFGLDVTQELAVVTTFADAGPRRIVGNYDYKLAHGALFDGAENQIDQLVFSQLNTDEDHYFAEAPGAAAEGDVVYEAIGRLASQPRSGQTGQAIMMQINAEGSGGLYRGVLLANATVGSTGNRDGRNMGATTSGQVFAVTFRLVTFDGTDITLKIQESQDDAGSDAYADISGLTSGALTGAGVVRVQTTAATEAYKRVNIAGTFTSAVIVVTAGVVVP